MNKHKKECRNHWCTGCGLQSDIALLRKEVASLKNRLRGAREILEFLATDGCKSGCITDMDGHPCINCRARAELKR